MPVGGYTARPPYDRVGVYRFECRIPFVAESEAFDAVLPRSVSVAFPGHVVDLVALRAQAW